MQTENFEADLKTISKVQLRCQEASLGLISEIDQQIKQPFLFVDFSCKHPSEQIIKR